MNILFLTHRVPFPLDKGDRIRSYNIIKFLANYHSISLMSVAHESTPADSYENLRKFCATVQVFQINSQMSKLKSFFHLFSQNALTLPAFYSKRFHRAVKEKLQREAFDLVYIFSSPMAQYAMGERIPKIMDFIDVDSQKWLDYAARFSQPMKSVYYREGIRLRLFEKMVAGACDRSIFASERELNIFKDIVPDARMLAVPNGTDIHRQATRPYRKNKLVFVGSMDYLPNIDAMTYFTREVLPLIRKEVPTVELMIVGRNPSRQMRLLGRLKSVTVTGAVDKIEPYLSDAAVSVIPLRIARGIQNKILEAMAHGVPVVTTTAALEGIEALPESEVLIGDDPRTFAEATVRLLKNKSMRQMLAENARALVAEKYDWKENLQPLNELITELGVQ